MVEASLASNFDQTVGYYNVIQRLLWTANKAISGFMQKLFSPNLRCLNWRWRDRLRQCHYQFWIMVGTVSQTLKLHTGYSISSGACFDFLWFLCSSSGVVQVIIRSSDQKLRCRRTSLLQLGWEENRWRQWSATWRLPDLDLSCCKRCNGPRFALTPRSKKRIEGANSSVMSHAPKKLTVKTSKIRIRHCNINSIKTKHTQVIVGRLQHWRRNSKL